MNHYRCRTVAAVVVMNMDVGCSMGTLAPRDKCAFWLLLRPMCHRRDNSLSSLPFTVICAHGRQEECEIKQSENVFVTLDALDSLREESYDTKCKRSWIMSSKR